MSAKSKAKKTVEQRKKAKKEKENGIKIPDTLPNGLKTMDQKACQEYISALDEKEISLMGAEAKIYEKAKDATKSLNEIIQVISQTEQQLGQLRTRRIQLEGARQGHIDTLLELEDERRAAGGKDAKAGNS